MLSIFPRQGGGYLLPPFFFPPPPLFLNKRRIVAFPFFRRQKKVSQSVPPSFKVKSPFSLFPSFSPFFTKRRSQIFPPFTWQGKKPLLSFQLESGWKVPFSPSLPFPPLQKGNLPSLSPCGRNVLLSLSFPRAFGTF